ncbi:glycoside hydrolase family 19 protein [Aquimarina sp. MMG016]|uniref:glycoside hydrolase family 19 protein n=1 Tax=Aquimarina sp. MMG016 TaxID=2822690 RepID=UPI001B3A610E|nr:glycoside hydrolase family 19 protein [Aquimarina sp. MMG016]MBQ4822716.1 cellulase family glycosylhydrolase [Aquimarina sp. MMG016]
MQTQNVLYKSIAILQFLIWSCFLSFTIEAQQTPVAQNGQLKVCGTQLCNQYNQPIQLRGMSTHGIQWYGWENCLTENSLDALAYDWDADILRISLYVQEGGYETDPVGFTNQVSRLINEATERGMYALVDWHQLNPGDPNANLENAKRFFTDIANQHKDKNNIIYDVCNEPNGSGVNWNRIKTYADQIIPVIRAIDNNAVVLIGTHGWSTFGVSGEGNLQDVIDNQLQFDNVMYTFHFYAKSHRDAYLNTLDQASNQLPVFVTEFGSQEYTGDGANDFVMTQRFIDLMRQKKISWTSWNYSDDFRSGAVWQTGTCSGGTWTTDRLKEAGRWIRDKIKYPEDNFPGGNGGDTQSPYIGSPINIPGKIEAENYDLGGQSIAFNDLTNTNQGGAYRNDAVDIEVSSEGGYNVGWIKNGEWLEYTVNVQATKTYTLESRVAAITSGRKFHIEVDGQNISGQINVPNTEGWQNWQTVTTNVTLNQGEQVIRIVMDSDDFNLDYLVFSNSTIPVNQPPVCAITSPSNNQTFIEGNSVSIAANASDSDGNITKVEFYNNNVLLDTDTSIPYTYVWNNIPQGSYSLRAKAYDNDGDDTTSSVVKITVNTSGGGGDNCGAETYIDGSAYETGAIVQNVGKTYECIVGGWCTVGGPYAPGQGWAWSNAWKKIGDCDALTFSEGETSKATCDVALYQNGATYQTGDEVQNFDKKYKCKVGGWCSIGGVYTPGGPDDWAWPSAWEELGPCDGGSDNQLPTVSITSPNEGAQFESGDQVTIMVAASDIDGSINDITFFMDDVAIGSDNTSPYEITFSPVDGAHQLKAIAVDNQGGATTSSTVNIVVNQDTGGDNCSLVVYVDGNTYQTGDEVQYLGKKYKCKVGGWCSAGGAYTPQEGWAWPYAWDELGACTGTPVNQLPQVTVLTPAVVYTETLPITIPLQVSAVDPDGTIQRITVEVGGGTLPLLSQGNDIYQSDWTFYNYGTFSYGAQAVDNEEGYTNFTIQVTIKEPIQGGDFLISKEEYNEFFPYRYGTDLTTYELDPTKDFFTYESFVEAIQRMNNIEITFERRKGTNLYRLTRKDKTTNQSSVIRTDPDFDADWNQSKPIITQVVDYGTFANEGNQTTIKRELAAFLANIGQETTGGWATAPGGPYSWGLHFREEQGYEGTTNIGYRDEGNIAYPPAPGKSYHGRGPIQLSWNYNYGQVSEFLFGDKNVMLNNPEQVLQDAALAFQTAIWFWMTPQHPKPSAHDVMVGNWIPSAYDQSKNRKPGFGMTVNIINGGLECGSGTEIPKVLGRIGFYERFTGILNVNNDLDTTDDCSECGCATMGPFFGLEPEDDARRIASDNILENMLEVEVAPNPFEDELRFSFNTLQQTKVSISIIDFNGHKVFNAIDTNLKSGNQQITQDVSALPSGMYFFRVQFGKETKTFKIVKR